MYYTTHPMFMFMQNPDLLVTQFFKILAIALKTTVDNVKMIPKNFSGNRYATENQVANGTNVITFQTLANGEKEYPKDEHGVVANIRAYEGTIAAADIDKAPWIPGLVQPELLNATFTITQNSLVVMKDIPMTIFTRSEEEPYSGNMALISPFPWLGQTDLKIVVNLKDQVAAVNTNLRFEVSGIAFI